MADVTYAKVGGPPDNWFGATVFDDEGREITKVVEVNTAECWVVRHVTDGNGESVVRNDVVVTERIEGKFTIKLAD